MKKLILYYNFVLVTLLVILGFLNATTISQLVSAVMFFPLAVIFTLLVFPKRRHAITLPVSATPVSPSQVVEIGEEIPPPTNQTGFDFDRRAFLKLIGSAGVSVFFFALFTKKAEAAFFGSVPGPGTVSLKDSAGTKIDPAEKHPTDGYKITQYDDSGVNAYAGFLNKDGAWFIQQEDASGNFRYFRGSSGFAASWADKEDLSYGYFDSVF